MGWDRRLRGRGEGGHRHARDNVAMKDHIDAVQRTKLDIYSFSLTYNLPSAKLMLSVSIVTHPPLSHPLFA